MQCAISYTARIDNESTKRNPNKFHDMKLIDLDVSQSKQGEKILDAARPYTSGLKFLRDKISEKHT